MSRNKYEINEFRRVNVRAVNFMQISICGPVEGEQEKRRNDPPPRGPRLETHPTRCREERDAAVSQNRIAPVPPTTIAAARPTLI